MLSGIGALTGAGAVIFAALIGADTFRRWRRQKNEERRIELAEVILTLAYKLQRAIEGIRSPGMSGREIEEVHDQLEKDGVINDEIPLGHKSILQTAQAALSRSHANRPLWDALLGTMPSAKAIFGEDVVEALDEFWTQRNRIIAAANSYARLIGQRTPRTEEEAERQFADKCRIEAILWSGGDENGVDGIADLISAAVKRLEALLLLIIRSDMPFGTKADLRLN